MADMMKSMRSNGYNSHVFRTRKEITHQLGGIDGNMTVRLSGVCKLRYVSACGQTGFLLCYFALRRNRRCDRDVVDLF